ncbi:MAG: zinc ABC transporter substrate-binding protein [Oscillospiraceae bacterium]|nr:zinc ABC transporter substrate-binding protein [Oscillospiraceae bacterium]
MKIFRKILSVLAAGALMLTCSACSSADNTETDGLKVITTNFPPYDFVKQISKGEIVPEMLLSGGQDSHSFEPTAQQIIAISEADIFICTGGESDAWVDEILMSMDTDVKVIRMMDCVEPLCAEEDHDHEDGHHHDHSEYDEHVWTSPKNAMKIADTIKEAMCEADPENTDSYNSGYAELYSSLLTLDHELTTAADSLTSPLIFGDRFPFLYMAHDYGIEYYAAFSGCSSETEPSAAKMTELIEAAKANNVKTIFYVEFSTQKVADTVAEAAGAETALFHSCHSVSDEDLQNGESYVSLMRKNFAKLDRL